MGACCSHSIARCAENAVAHDLAYDFAYDLAHDLAYDLAYAFAHSAVLDLERASR